MSSATAARLSFLTGCYHIDYGAPARRTRTLEWGASLHLRRLDSRVPCQVHAFSRIGIALGCSNGGACSRPSLCLRNRDGRGWLRDLYADTLAPSYAVAHISMSGAERAMVDISPPLLNAIVPEGRWAVCGR